MNTTIFGNVLVKRNCSSSYQARSRGSPNMAQTMALPSKSIGGPPSFTLPPVPAEKARRNFSSPFAANRTASSQQIPSKLAIRTPSKDTTPIGPLSRRNSGKSPTSIPMYRSISNNSSLSPTLQGKPLPSLPAASTTNYSLVNKGSASTDRTLKKAISYASFPQPPKSVGRTISYVHSATAPATPSSEKPPRRSLGDVSSSKIGSVAIRNKRPRLSNDAAFKLATMNGKPSLLNGSGEGKSVVPDGDPGKRGSDGLLSLPSPGHSRSSSAQGSYSTSATTFEDVEENARRGKESGDEGSRNSPRQKGNGDGKGNVVVSVRIRPDSSNKGDTVSKGDWMVDGRRSLVGFRGREGGDYFYGKILQCKRRSKRVCFVLTLIIDNVFTSQDGNDKVYTASAKRLVRRVMEGYNGTVFAYGMTGTGKTYSMQGTDDSPGVIPMAITDIFAFIRETPRKEFLIRVSYLEIYNEKLHDLLSSAPVNQQAEIKLREDGARGVYATPLTEEVVQSPMQLLKVIHKGDMTRRTQSTQFNTHSSRSHAVVQITVESRDRCQDKRAPIAPGGCRVSTLSLIDLAGSERAAESKDRRIEGAHINKSLLTLGTVIGRLSSEESKNGGSDKDKKHLPYRDSKLTRLLQSALSGDSLISILCTIQIGSSGSVATASNLTLETLNTLKFASRAKNNIVSHAKVTEEVINSGADPRVLLDRYRLEIQNLRSQLDIQNKTQAKIMERQVEKEADVKPILEMEMARTALTERIEHLQRLILSSQSAGVNSPSTRSSLSMHPKLAAFGRNNSGAGTHSIRSSASRSTLHRTHSDGSTATNRTQLPMNSSFTRSHSRSPGSHDSESPSIKEGDASLRAQNRALQADLADKNKYISTLEDRLHQARRVSSSLSSLGFSPALQDKTAKLAERDEEVLQLKQQLQEKERMLVVLRNAIRNRNGGANAPYSLLPTNLKPALITSDATRPIHSRKVSWDQIKEIDGESDGECSEKSDFSAVDIAPVRVLASPKIVLRTGEDHRKSVDEVSRILDEMIGERVRAKRESLEGPTGVVGGLALGGTM